MLTTVMINIKIAPFLMACAAPEPAALLAVWAAASTLKRDASDVTPVVLEATAEVSDDAGELPDGDTDIEQDGDGCADDVFKPR
jgi:hypothetical protein